MSGPDCQSAESVAYIGSDRLVSFCGLTQGGSDVSGFLQRMSGLKDVIAFMMRIKPSDITKAMALLGKIQDESADLRVRVVAVIDLADLLVDYTDTPADDQVVDFVKSLAAEDALWKLVAIVQDLLDGGAVPVGAMEGPGLVYGQPEEGQEAKAIPWPLVIQLAQLIVMFLQNRKKD